MRSSKDSYDLCVLGGGPGGFSAAVRSARTGARVCLVDPGPLGGTCLNRGCIPSRALGTTARFMAQMRKAETLGIQVGDFRVDLKKVLERKERILRRLRGGLGALLSRSEVTWLQGEGVLRGPQEVEVLAEGRPGVGVRPKRIILATGSSPGCIPSCPSDGKAVVTSDEILDLAELPTSLIVVGAGVIGCEFASYFADLGVPVTLVEAAGQILPGQDPDISRAFQESLKRRGVKVHVNSKVQGIQAVSGSPSVTLTDGQALKACLVLVAAGRSPRLPGGVEEAGVKLEEGSVAVDEMLRTSAPSIYAIGDLLGEHQLAGTASYEGSLAAENALGQKRKADYRVVPETIYTEPEIASVGQTQSQAAALGLKVKVSRLSFTGFPRAQTLEETEGFIQVVADGKSGELLGVQMIGARATDLIGEAALAIRERLTLRQLEETLHAHPTMSESLWEASAAALDRSIYYASGQ
ncbi:MAG: dihydrolipoyl dehydrogenase [Candidatus Omnitrophica bacterium]|nr:dihydrolipoyl dehydrogenase [Candidatus Omnitrophota bacterium]